MKLAYAYKLCDRMLAVADFGEYLLHELGEHNWSQSELARKAGVSRAAISDIISGRRRPGVDLCISIAGAFDVPPEIVFREAGLLPRQNNNVLVTNELLFFKLRELSEGQLDEVIQFINFIQERDKRRMLMEGKRGEYSER